MVNGKVIGQMTLNYGPRESRISVDIKLSKMTESSGWTSMTSAMNSTRFIFVETTRIQEHGRTSSSKEAGKELMPRVFLMLKIEAPRWRRIHNMVLL